MDLDLSFDQQLVQSTARKFLEKEFPVSRMRALVEDASGFDRDAWSQVAELGWFAPLVPEEDGGGSVSGAPVVDTSIVAEEVGRAMFPGPVIPTNVVAYAIAHSGSPEQREEHLPGLMDGTTIGTWALAEEDGRWDAEGVQLVATPSDGRWELTGVKSFVQEAGAADLLLVTARGPQGLVQFMVPRDAPGVSVVPLDSLDLARRFAEVHFDGTRLPAVALLGEGDALDAVERQLDLAGALVCAETVGALDRSYETTLDYARERRAFGRPIGSFQALKHRFADMLLWLEGAKAVAVAAAQAVDREIARAELVSTAKSYISERAPMIVRDCLQIHGGIGYTWEYDLHFYLRRIESNSALYGGIAHHRDRLAAVVGI